MSAKEWTTAFQNELSGIPVLVCLTYADKLCEDQSCIDFFNPSSSKFKSDVKNLQRKFNLELKVSEFLLSEIFFADDQSV